MHEPGFTFGRSPTQGHHQTDPRGTPSFPVATRSWEEPRRGDQNRLRVVRSHEIRNQEISWPRGRLSVAFVLVVLACLTFAACDWLDWDGETVVIRTENDLDHSVRIVFCEDDFCDRTSKGRHVQPGEHASSDIVVGAPAVKYQLQNDDGTVVGCLSLHLTEVPSRADRFVNASDAAACNR